MPKDRDRERPPVIEVGATVRMKKLRVEEVSGVETEVHGEPGFETETSSRRENLPDEVEEGRTYRGAVVHRRTSVRLDDSD